MFGSGWGSNMHWVKIENEHTPDSIKGLRMFTWSNQSCLVHNIKSIRPLSFIMKYVLSVICGWYERLWVSSPKFVKHEGEC